MSAGDSMENKAQDLKGRGKEALGAATDNDSMKNEGKADQAKASIKDKAEQVKDKVTEQVDKIL